MSYSTFTYKMKDGKNIHLHKWLPLNNKPSKLLFLIHGAVEHGKRYDSFANQLTEQGFVVIAPDYRGHGLTALEDGVFSHFGDSNGFMKVVQDLDEILTKIKLEYPTLPRAIFGHSLGSFLVRKFISLRGEEFNATIISATSWGNSFEMYSGLFLSKIWSLFTNKNKPNKFFNDFLWMTINSKVKSRKGTLDFINSDEKEVKKYQKDPLNGNIMSIEFGEQLSKALLIVREDEVFKNTPNELNIYIASGLDDPLANKGKDIKNIAEKYKDSGSKNVTVKLYPKARHEILNEANNHEITKEMLEWLNVSI
ncbi:MAG: hypothetical protein COB01_02580 [Lutibacter sp.]|nr:MAG: hypothetical protein COB01_02580 [Lutibacter sp.]